MVLIKENLVANFRLFSEGSLGISKVSYRTSLNLIRSSPNVPGYTTQFTYLDHKVSIFRRKFALLLLHFCYHRAGIEYLATMGKIIRPTYPKELSIGLLILIFFLSFFLSSQIFDVSWRDLIAGEANAYLGMVLVAIAVVIMVLILWEDFLFQVKIRPEADHVVFRNHPTKLKSQILMYFAIPAIFAFIYFQFDVRLVRFAIWAAVCLVLPVIATLISGINNYNDFLKLGTDTIGFKNNEKEGDFPLSQIQHITAVRDERKVLHKLRVLTVNGEETLIDLDEMELDAYLGAIDKFMVAHYPQLIRS